MDTVLSIHACTAVSTARGSVRIVHSRQNFRVPFLDDGLELLRFEGTGTLFASVQRVNVL